MKIVKKIILVSAFMGTCSFSMESGFIYNLGAHIGGDQIAQATNENGTTDYTWTHSGYSVKLGMYLEVTDLIGFTTTLGYMQGTAEGAYGDYYAFYRFPLEVAGVIDLGFIRLGVGLTSHLGTGLSLRDGAGGTLSSTKFSSTLGQIYTLEFVQNYAGNEVHYGLQGTIISYEANGISYSGDGLSGYVGMRLNLFN